MMVTANRALADLPVIVGLADQAEMLLLLTVGAREAPVAESTRRAVMAYVADELTRILGQMAAGEEPAARPSAPDNSPGLRPVLIFPGDLVKVDPLDCT